MGDTPPDRRLLESTPRDAQAARLARAARAAEELCATLWEAMHEELRRPGERRVAELAERLTQVCSAVADLAAEQRGREKVASSPAEVAGPELVASPSAEVAGPELVASPSGEESGSELVASPSGEEPGQEPAASTPTKERASELAASVPEEVLEIAVHDIRREGVGPSVASGGTGSPGVEPGEQGSAARVRGGEDRPEAERDGEGPVVWAEAIEAHLERYAVDGLPFAVLVVEVLGVEWIARAEPPAALAHLLGSVEQAIGPELRSTDGVVRESRGRWWLTASRTDAGGARTLAERLARIVRTAASHRGVPLDLAIGIAAYPADGGDAAALAAHADVSLYAARAAGQPVAPVEE